ncbi:MAG TPA: ice-binding family protein [Candidatus Acidoferrum sp.]|nr:ice-binding family protein [Candidatus Acidoferrum sp.]
MMSQSMVKTGALALLVLLPHFTANGAQAPVDLGTAGNYVVLAQTGVSTTGAASVKGNIGLSPAATTFFTGFSETLDPAGQFALSPFVDGKLYGADMVIPTPSELTTAIGDMGTAFTDAAGRALPDFTEEGAGNLDGLTLTPGLHKWGTGVTIPIGVTLAGTANDIWIFQIAQNLVVGNGAIVTLSGGAQAKNIFWQVSGQVTIGTTADFQGIILCQTLIALKTGATLHGRALAQTAVTIEGNAITNPGTRPPGPRFGPILRTNDVVTLTITNMVGIPLTVQRSSDMIGWTTLSASTPTITPYVTTDSPPASATNRFYRTFYP